VVLGGGVVGEEDGVVDGDIVGDVDDVVDVPPPPPHASDVNITAANSVRRRAALFCIRFIATPATFSCAN